MSSDVSVERAKLQEAMTFLGALADGLERAIGDSSTGISYVAGKRLGLQLSSGISKTNDVIEALNRVREVLTSNNCLWNYEPFQKHDRPAVVQQTAKGEEVEIVFRDCMIRQSLFRYGHSQKGSLCNMMSGFFDGALQNIMGSESELTILHAGENACFKKLVIKKTNTV
jgi:predicted hydrocarbon binding protein